jgi:hypothetical protein
MILDDVSRRVVVASGASCTKVSQNVSGPCGGWINPRDCLTDAVSTPAGRWLIATGCENVVGYLELMIAEQSIQLITVLGEFDRVVSDLPLVAHALG